MLSIMRGGWFDVFVDVEWDVTGLGVGHVLSIRQIIIIIIFHLYSAFSTRFKGAVYKVKVITRN